jgi:hypothetical protein
MPVIRIQETPPGLQNIGVLGFVWYCNNVSNPNDQPILYDTWIEIYALTGVGSAEKSVLVDKQGQGFVYTLDAHVNHEILSGAHPVFVNETVTAGTARYMLHMVVEAYASKTVPYDPPSVDERWINVTFTPGSSDTLYREGGECGAFGP